MSDDLVSRLRDEAMRLSGQSIDRGCVDSGIGSNLADAAADALSEARAEIERLRAERDCYLDNWKEARAYLAIETSHAAQAESALSTLRARVREVVGPVASADFADCRDCTDNNGRPYQSQWLADALRAARQLMEEVK